MSVLGGSELAEWSVCSAQDWDISALPCSSVPALPPCAQHAVVSLIPVLGILAAILHIAWVARHNKLKVKYFGFI